MLSAALAATGAWRGSRVAKWQAYWPVPLMAFAIALAARDLGLMFGSGLSDFPLSSLLLGIWAGLIVTLVGAIEIWTCRRGGSDGQRLVAATALIASGSTLLLYSAGSPAENRAPTLASGLLILLSGVLLATLRSMARPAPLLNLLWAGALMAGALVHRPAHPPDTLAEAGYEMELVLSALRRAGARVVPTEAPAGITSFARGSVRTFRVDGNDVQIYLIAHDQDATPDVHLSPRAVVPPPIQGIPHLHAGPHILVLCITADPRFARQLARIVHHLGGYRRRGSFGLASARLL